MNGPRRGKISLDAQSLRKMLASVYLPEGVELWLAHAETQGWSLDEQVRRAESLLGQVAT